MENDELKQTADPGGSLLNDVLGYEFNKWGAQVYGDKWPRINRIDLLEHGFINGYRKALGRPISDYPYILVTIDLAEQKVVGVKFCKNQAELTAFQTIFKDDFGDGYVTFAHAYEAA